MDSLVNIIVAGGGVWETHPILCAMQQMWVRKVTPPASWEVPEEGMGAVLLTLDLGFGCESNPAGFPHYYEMVHASVSANPDLVNAMISGSRFVVVTVDLRRLICDMRIEGWRDGISAIVDKLTARAGCIFGLVSHVIEQGVLDHVVDWPQCLRWTRVSVWGEVCL